jgi:septal ring factor EnvC (AmiA/AmiB activator)
MQKKVTAEGVKEKDLFEKFMCYCKNGKGALEGSIEAGKSKSEQLTASIKETSATLTQTKADLKTAQTDRKDAKEAVAKATSLREKEAAAFAKESGDLKTNIAALTKATTAIEKGMGGAFLQTSTASILKQLSITMEISSVDREMLTSFLTQGQGNGYAPQSGQIVGILKQMTDTMSKTLAEVTEEEESAIKNYEDLMAAKTKEINALTKSIESKIAQIGELGVQLVTQKEDLDDTTKSVVEDAAFLKDLEKNCKTKEDEWAVRCKVRAEELLALADTIKLLNDDDALELFKKTLPTPSLLQLKTNGKAMKEQALAALTSKDVKNDFRLNLITLALKGKKVSFDKVLKMIDDMVVLLGKEQTADDEKKEYCEKTIDKTEDDLKELELTVSDLGKAIDDLKESIATLASEIEALEDGIKALDKQVAEATEERKTEHAENVETLANDNAAKEIIGIAKNRLNKFYNPKLYVAPPKRELSEEERITLNMGGTLAPTNAPGGIGGTGVEAMFAQSSSRVAPPPPPETFGAYAKKGKESNGVITMMDMLVADLDKEINEVTTEEKENQAEYESFMADSAAKRASDAKSIADKESAKADAEASLIKHEEEKKSTTKEAMATAEYLSEVHADCDWLLTNFAVRKEARAGEVDALKKAKAVLSGADYSLLQSARVHRHVM